MEEIDTWTSWSAWGDCSATCGWKTGLHYRSCECKKTDNNDCAGPKSEGKQCFVAAQCPDEGDTNMTTWMFK